jgi:hypothetical protein
MLEAMNNVKESKYAGRRPMRSDIPPIMVGAMPWKT